MTSVVLSVPSISCDHCKYTITRLLEAQPGVESVSVAVPEKRVQLTFDDSTISLVRLQALLDEEDYPVESLVEC